MRILVVNDDSVTATQLLPLVRWCQKLGDVTVVVPKVEQSGKSHGIELRHPFKVHQMMLEDVPVYAIESTPADCVRFAMFGLGMEFDLVISGINRGLNMGTDILYSGTVAAICEAALQGVPAIALSTSLEYYDRAVERLDEVESYIREHKLMEKHSLYNINIPEERKGFRITRQGGPFFSDDFVLSDDGMCTPNGKCIYVNSNDLTLDTDAVMSGYVSITPLSVNQTEQTVYQALSALNDK
jgi:5'-nucleotidase